MIMIFFNCYWVQLVLEEVDPTEKKREMEWVGYSTP